jgi:hypothetical protein
MTAQLQVQEAPIFPTNKLPRPFPLPGTNIAASNPDGISVDVMYPALGYDPYRCAIHPETVKSMANLLLAGVDVRVAYPEVLTDLTAENEQRVMRGVVERESMFPRNGLKEHLFDLDGSQGGIHPVGMAWLAEAKRSHSLLIISDNRFFRFGGEATSEALNTPMFSGGMSAAGVIETEARKRKKDPDYARGKIARIGQFLDTEVSEDGKDAFGNTSRDYIFGVPDSRAVREREAITKEAITRYAQSIPEIASGGRGLKLASIGCGAGNMPCSLVPEFTKLGLRFDRIDFLDWDVVALAVAAAHAEGSGLGNVVAPRRFDVVKGDASKELSDVDVKEMLGFFEYLPLLISKYGVIGHHMAQDYLRSVGVGMKPGSLIVFGNMLRDRPNQSMFDQVWPRLQQRSPEEVVELIISAGYPKESIQVDVSNGGIYAVYTVTIPESGLILPKRSLKESVARRLLLGTVQEY